MLIDLEAFRLPCKNKTIQSKRLIDAVNQLISTNDIIHKIIMNE